MSESDSPHYKALFLREKRRNQHTTFSEFIRACHTLLSTSLKVETPSRSTRGTIPPPTGKYCPTRLRLWEDCPARQQAIYDAVCGYLQPSQQDSPRLFSPLAELEGLSRRFSRRPLSSEQDLESYERFAVKTTSMIGVRFDNHANALDEAEVDLSEDKPANPHRSRPDQFCIHRIDDDNTTLLTTVEYKPPHKLSVENLRVGLRPMDFWETVVKPDSIPVDEAARLKHNTERLVGAALVQEYHVMIQEGLASSYLTNGLAQVLLHIPYDDPILWFPFPAADPYTTWYFILAVLVISISDDSPSMSRHRRGQYFYRCFSASSAGRLRCGMDRVGPRLSQAELLFQFDRHRDRANRIPTALVSVSDRIIEALHRGLEKYYNLSEDPGRIWIAIIFVPDTDATKKSTGYHHAKKLAQQVEKMEDPNVFEYEYIFEWEVPEQYVEHRVSLQTLLDRGLDLCDYLDETDHLPDLKTLRKEMTKRLLNPSFSGYDIGRSLGRMARCFGARAPVYEIASQLLTDCPRRIGVNHQYQTTSTTALLDLSAQAEQLEVQLTRTFRVASNWKVVLLLDEADVYLQRRDGLHLERNRLVATFLRTLEYYPGIFFLTTNMLQDFDAAILDRIHLKLQYHDLDSSARQAIFRRFSVKTGAEIWEDEIRNFAKVSLNGRQIKDVIKLAHNVAMSKGVRLRADHIRSALRANGYTIPTPGSRIDNSLYD
ncbi:hypothetical protein IFM51744_10551 [Aspergillus udagawae]|nr:hypothetical protein IFM51744_10551 [Aspergillus udagawae]